MTRFRLTPLAERDLEEIVDTISERSSPDRAHAVLREILAAAERLAGMPGMGHARADLTDEPVLFWSLYRYLIVYRPETRPLELLRVLHGRQDVEAKLRGSR